MNVKPILFCWLLAASLSFADEPVEFKTVTFDDFFAGQLEPMPLTLKVPKHYEHAEGLEVDLGYTYWMRPDVVAAVKTNGDLPGETGYLWGKVSLDVGFLPDEKKFSHEDSFKAELEAAGHAVLAFRKRDTGGHAVCSTVVSMKQEDGTKRLVFMAYVAMNIESNCVMLSYNPPARSSEEAARKTWDAIIDSIAKK